MQTTPRPKLFSTMSPNRRWRRFLSISLVQLVPVVLFCRDFVFKGELLLSPEVLDMSYGWSKHLDRIGWRFRETLWDPYSFCGIPFLANPATRTLYPPDLFLRLLTPLSPEKTFSYLIFFHYWMLGIGGAVWLRKRFRSAAGAALGGWILVANGYLAARTGLADPAFLFAVTWLPWILHSLSRLRNRWTVPVLALLLSLEVLAGRPDITFYFAYLHLFYLTVRWFPRLWNPAQRRSLPGWCLRLLAAGACALLLTSIQVLSTAELGSRSINRSGEPDFAFVATDSLYPPQFVLSLFPRCLSDPLETPTPGSLTQRWRFWLKGGGYHEVYFYLGLGTLVLAVVGTASRLAGRERWFWAGVFLVAVALSMGRFSPLFRLAFDYLPGWNRFRVPPRVLVWTLPSVAFLAAAGLDRITTIPDRILRRENRVGLTAFFLLLVWVALIAILAGRFVTTFLAPDDELARLQLSPEAVGSLHRRLTHDFRWGVLGAFCFLVAPFILCWIGYRKRLAPAVVKWGIAALVLADLCFANARYVRGLTRYEFQDAFPDDPLIEKFLQDPDGGRLLVLGSSLQYLRREIHPWFFPGRLFAYGVESPTGYGPFLIQDYVRAFEAVVPEEQAFNGGVLLFLFSPKKFDWKRLRYFHVTHFISDEAPPDPATLVASHTYRGEGGSESTLYLWKDPEAYPRAFLTETKAEEFRPPDPSLGTVRVMERSPTHVVLDVETNRGADLRLLDTWYPGWTCRIDDHPASIRQTGGTFRSVFLESGRHRVVLEFDPPSWRYGKVLTVVGLLFWFFLLFRGYPPPKTSLGLH